MGHGVWVPAFAGTTPSVCYLMQTPLRAAHQPAGPRAGGASAALRHDARDDSGVIAVDLLQQTAAADREGVMNFRRMQMQPGVVHDVDIGPVAWRDHAT